MSRIKRYDFEKYSIFDISEYLQALGYDTEKKYVGQAYELIVIGTAVSIDFPVIYSIRGQGPQANIRFADYPKKENYEESKKLFEQLKRKFGVKFNTRPKKIKDADKMEIIDYS